MRYSAIFQDGEELRAVGPFNHKGSADEFGRAYACEGFPYVGACRFTTRAEIGVISGSRSADYRYGIVGRWYHEADHGFLTDEDGQSWFVSYDLLPGDLILAIRVGTEVRFTGSPKKFGNKYPTAFNISIV